MGEIRHRPLTFLLIVATAITLVVTIIFSSLASIDVGSNKLFKYGVGRSNSRESEYPSEIRPSSWTFFIWIFIFIFQLGWVIYTHTLLCRQNNDNKDYLYYDPPFLPPTFYAIYILGLTFTVVWLFAWDNDFVSASFVCLFGACMCLCICIFFSTYFLWHYEDRLGVADMWVNIILLQNGLGIYATWTLLAALLNLNTVLISDTKAVNKEDAGIICLSILLGVFLIYLCMDVFLSRKRLRYFIAPYIVLVVALSGIVDNNWNPDLTNSRFAVSILAIVLLGSVVKIVALVYRIIMDPLRIEKKCGQS